VCGNVGSAAYGQPAFVMGIACRRWEYVCVQQPVMPVLDKCGRGAGVVAVCAYKGVCAAQCRHQKAAGCGIRKQNKVFYPQNTGGGTVVNAKAPGQTARGNARLHRPVRRVPPPPVGTGKSVAGGWVNGGVGGQITKILLRFATYLLRLVLLWPCCASAMPCC